MASQPGYNILLVDDEEQTHIFVEDMLMMAQGEGHFDLTCVVSFNDAIAALLSGQHDACLMDYHLGGYSGIDLLKHATGHGNRTPIIMLTGHGNRDVDLGALEAGAAEFLDKSRLKPELLIRTLRYAIKHQQDKNQLEDLYQQVSELEQLKTDMIRIAAHDLRTPLTTMLNYANFLRDDADNPLQDYQQGYVDDIIGSVHRMQKIISDILSLERIQATVDERYMNVVDLAEQIHAAMTVTLPTDGSQQVIVEVPPSGVMVQGDAAQLLEAVANLMTNAVKYTPAGGTIEVRLVVAGTHAVFTITDNGYGIPDAMQSRLFQPFYRAKSKETRKIEGTGLGLHLVRNVVRRHHGEIIFHSVYGEGSTFGFRMPLYT
jgi:two-component system, sensor histidine kinase and response regulator